MLYLGGLVFSEPSIIPTMSYNFHAMVNGRSIEKGTHDQIILVNIGLSKT